MRKWLLLLAVVVALGTAVIAWLGVEDARQVTFLDARTRDAEYRSTQALRRERQLIRDGAPQEDVMQAALEEREA